MAKNNIKNDAITPRDVDFAQWYTDVCRKAELMDYSSVKGFIIYRHMVMLYGNRFRVIWIRDLRKQDIRMFICQC
mgnify:CR=1 FL=1